MDARIYYNQRSTYRRRLDEGDSIRNTHNFIKAVLISNTVPNHAHILDLGCGQGGDLLKYKRCNPRSYRGIDISHTAIEAASKRIAQIGFKCRVRLDCCDFAEHDWGKQSCKIDAVGCNFALQYAFATRERARHTISRIALCLKPGGLFFGTIPVHENDPTYQAVIVQLPDDKRQCVEYSAQKNDVVSLCAEYDMVCMTWKDFDAFYDDARVTHAKLLQIMHADCRRPDPHNAVFVFEKKTA